MLRHLQPPEEDRRSAEPRVDFEVFLESQKDDEIVEAQWFEPATGDVSQLALR